jgi:hypothetical protein
VRNRIRTLVAIGLAAVAIAAQAVSTLADGGLPPWPK